MKKKNLKEKFIEKINEEGFLAALKKFIKAKKINYPFYEKK